MKGKPVYQPWNWRRKTFLPSQIDALKVEFFSYVKEAFFIENNSPILNENDKTVLRYIFNWILGVGIEIKENKGILLTGSVGIGKTSIMKGVVTFIDRHYAAPNCYNGIATPLIVSSYKMAEFYRLHNEYMISRMRNSSIVCIDDIGVNKEPIEVTYMGTKIRPFEDLLNYRYDKKKCILLTSNDTPDALGHYYGWHCYDRIKQMTNLLILEGKSKR